MLEVPEKYKDWAEIEAKKLGVKHAIFLIPSFGVLPESLRIGKLSDNGYREMGGQVLYRTNEGKLG